MYFYTAKIRKKDKVEIDGKGARTREREREDKRCDLFKNVRFINIM